jgi:selenocysteine lyase/cysteine desulfurase
VQSASGYRVDLETLAGACRARGARLFVDATQSLGALRVSLDGVDFLATTAYKWLLSPRGTAFLYVAPERLAEQVPLQPSWKTPADPYAAYYGPPLERAADASALDVSLAWPVWLGTARALELLLEIGPRAIEERDLELARRFRHGLRAIGLAPLFEEPECSQIVALKVGDPEALEASLARDGVVAAVRGCYLRASFHLFNDEQDVERALAALRRA